MCNNASARFLFPELRIKILIILKFTWGQSMAWLNFGANLCNIITCSNFSVCAVPAPYKIPTFTPELQTELTSPIQFKGRGLVQCVSNGVCFCSIFVSHPLACFLCVRVKIKLSNKNFSSQNGKVVGKIEPERLIGAI